MKIAISGMISSGKSSLTTALVEYYSKFKPATFLSEFKEDDIVFHNLLKWHLQRRANVTLAFETYVMDSHISELTNIEAQMKRKYDEFDIFLDRFCVEHIIFAQNAFDLSSRHWKSYKKMVDQMINPTNIPDFVIFLDVDFDTFKKRLFKRNRSAEVDNWDTNYDYYKKMHSTYKQNFIDLCHEYNVNYAIINTNNLDENEVLKASIDLIEQNRKKLKNEN